MLVGHAAGMVQMFYHLDSFVGHAIPNVLLVDNAIPHALLECTRCTGAGGISGASVRIGRIGRTRASRLSLRFLRLRRASQAAALVRLLLQLGLAEDVLGIAEATIATGRHGSLTCACLDRYPYPASSCSILNEAGGKVRGCWAFRVSQSHPEGSRNGNATMAKREPNATDADPVATTTIER